MKRSRRKNLIYWLKKAKRKVKRAKIQAPSDGSMMSIFYGDLDKNGGHYQIEYVHDIRMHDVPYIVVFWWPRTRRQGSIAPYYLDERK